MNPDRRGFLKAAAAALAAPLAPLAACAAGPPTCPWRFEVPVLTDQRHLCCGEMPLTHNGMRGVVVRMPLWTPLLRVSFNDEVLATCFPCPLPWDNGVVSFFFHSDYLPCLERAVKYLREVPYTRGRVDYLMVSNGSVQAAIRRVVATLEDKVVTWRRPLADWPAEQHDPLAAHITTPLWRARCAAQ